MSEVVFGDRNDGDIFRILAPLYPCARAAKCLMDIFEQNIGFSKILLASFFTQGQSTDKDLFKSRHRIIFEFSQLLIKVNKKIPLLTKFADNLFLISQKNT